MEERSTDTIQVKCPFCKQRLFDIEKDAEGVVSIKCLRCRAVVSVSMHHHEVHQPVLPKYGRLPEIYQGTERYERRGLLREGEHQYP